MSIGQLDKRALQSFLNALGEPAFLVDRDLRIRAANRSFAAPLGIALCELIGEPLSRFIKTEMGERRRACIERVMRTGQEEIFEDNREGRYFVNHITPVLGDAEKVDAVAVFALEITETRRAQTSMRASEARCQQIVSTCLEGVWQIDENNETSFVNPQMAAMFGYTVDEFIGCSMFDFMDDEARKAAMENVSRRKDGIAERHEFRFRHKTGRDVWASLATNPIYGPDGAYAGAVALVTDISEARLLEKRVQQTQKLESLGLLAGGIAHDFNNLLVGILANVGIAQRDLPPHSRGQSTLDEIQRAAEAAAKLTSELLAYSGSGQFVTEPLYLAEVVVEVAGLLSKVLSKSARIDVEPGNDSPVVLADQVQLRQVIMNLFTNASEALGDTPGTIKATVSIERLSADDIARLQIDNQLEPDEYACLQVVDSGQGMSEETQSRIFDPFFTTKFTGRGLGLAAVQGILRGHRAGLRIDSKVGQGSTIRVYFPRSTLLPAKPIAPETEARTRRAGFGLVLVVDDEATVRETAVQILKLSGFEVISCANGEEALALIQTRGDELSAVLLDHTMPGLNGSQVFLKLREAHPTLAVVLTSGYTRKGITLESSGNPATFLKKPFSIDQLLDTMFATIDSSS